MATPMINTRLLLHVVRLLDDVASPSVIDRALRKAGLSREVLAAEAGFLPLATVAVFGEAVARASGERHIGVLIGEIFRYRALGWYCG